MQKHVSAALIVICLVGSSAGVGLFAFFSDEALSTGNLINTAIVDLQIDGQESIGAFIGGNALLPTECLTGSTVLTNAGTRFAPDIVLDMWIDYTDSDDLGQYLEISNLDYGAHPDLQTVLTDMNGNGWVDVDDWATSAIATTGITEPGAAGTTVFLEICLRAEADNHLQNEGVTVAFHFRLRQPADTGLPFAAPAGWDYFRTVDVTNTNGALPDQQVLFTFDSSASVAAGRLQADCDDLRVYDDSGAALSMWIEGGCGTSTTRVWFKAPSLATGTTTYYALHGNAAAGSVSSVASTFIADIIAHRSGSCTNSILCGFTDSANEMSQVRALAANICTGTSAKIDWGSVCDGSGFSSTVRENFYARHRFLFAPAQAGTWTFATDSDDASELIKNPGDSATPPATTAVVAWYGGHGSCACTTHAATTGLSGPVWLDYAFTEWTGGEAERLWAQSPSAGVFSIVSTANFPGQIFGRSYPATDPTAAVSAELAA